MRWTFGVEPLAQTQAAAPVLRRLVATLLAVEHDDPEVARLTAEIDDAERRIAARGPASSVPRIGSAAESEGRVYIDHARDIGAYNPCFPEYEIEVDGDRAHGTVTFPIAYEGPPGLVHGGFLAVFFDCVVQHHNCEVGVAGKTTGLDLRFRRPARLLTPLEFDLVRTADGDRITTVGRLRSTGQRGGVVCEAEMTAVAGDVADLPVASPRRSEP